MNLFCKNLLVLPPFIFTGTFQKSTIILSGIRYQLIALLSNGTFTAMHEKPAQIWMCGGGAAGGSGSNYSGGYGGAGGKTRLESITLQKLVDVAVVVGQGGAVAFENGGGTGFGNIGIAGGVARTGGSGGGQGGGDASPSSSLGENASTVPFGDTVNFMPHCGGGGGGGASIGSLHYTGGNGGSNGNNGLPFQSDVLDTVRGGSGGVPGGGNGGYFNTYTGTTIAGTNASFFGCGGGGGGRGNANSIGRGYQGVIYLLYTE